MDQLFNHFSDIPALEKEKSKVLSIFDEIEKGIMDLSKLGFKIDSAKGIAELNQANKTLEKTMGDLAAAQKKILETEQKLNLEREKLAKISNTNAEAARKETKAYEGLSNEMSDNIKKQIDLKQRLEEVTKSINKLKEFGAVAKNSKDYQQEMERLVTTQQTLKVEIEQTNRFVKNQAREFLAAEGSLDQMRAQLNQMLQAYDAAGDEWKDSSGGKAALKTINDLTDAIYKQEQASKRYQRNVGNYQGSAKIIVEALEAVSRRAQKLPQDLGKAGPEARQVRAEMEALQRITADPKFLQVSAKYGDAIAETRYFTKALIDLERQGLKDSAAANELRSHLAELTDQVSDVRQEIKAMSSDTRGFDLFASSIGTVSSAFQTAASAAELAGGNSEDVQRSIQRLVAIQNVANGVRQIATDLTTKGSAANKAYAFAQTQVAILTNTATTSVQKFNAAMKLSAIGLLITGLTLAASKMGLFGDNTDDADKQLEKLNATMEVSNHKLDTQIKSLERQLAIRLSLLKQQGKGEKEISDATVDGLAAQEEAYKKEAATRNESLKSSLKLALNFAGNLDEVTGAFGGFGEFKTLTEQGIPTLEKADQLLNQLKEFKGTDAFQDFSDAAKKNFERIVTSVQGVYDILEKADTKNFEGTQEKNKIKEDDAAKERDRIKQANEDAKKLAADERKYAFELSQFKLQLAAEEQAAFKNLETPDAIRLRVQAAQQEFNIRKKMLDDQREYELKQEGVTASQRELIRLQSLNAIRELEVQLSLDIANIYKTSNEQILQEAKDFQEEYERIEQERIQKQQDNNVAMHQSLQNQIDTQAAQAREAAAKNFKDTKEGREKYAEEIIAIESKRQKRQLENDVDFYTTQINLLRETGASTVEAEKALAEARAKLAEDSLVKAKEAADKRLQIEQALIDAYAGLRQSLMAAFDSTVQGAFDARKNLIQEEIDKVNELKDAEIKRITESTDAEETKAAKITIVEAKAQADRERLERRQKEIDRNKALFDRTFKAFQISTDGIRAVAKLNQELLILKAASTTNPLLLPLIPLAAAQIPISIATTAANLVALLATPIPKFAKGTTASPSGMAIVGEAGREIGMEPSGKIKLWEKPTLTNLIAGTKIFPNKVTESILAAAEHDRFNFFSHTGSPMYVQPDRTDEVVDQLKALNKKSRIYIHNEHGIESTPYYHQQIKY